MTTDDRSWSAQGTSPGEIEAALRELLKQRHADNEAYAPARVLNLIVIADREWRGEILNRLDRVGRYHASRTILCAIEPGRTEIDAWATMTGDDDPAPGELAITHEQVVLDIGPHQVEHLDRIVDPLVVTDLATLVWSPHGHPEAVDALMHLAQIVLLDSVDEPDPRTAVARASELEQRAYLVDLAWLRSTPWRERMASTFDPPQWRDQLAEIASVTVRHRPDSAIAALLLIGWLAQRLGWQPGAMTETDGGMSGTAASAAGEVALALEPDATMTAPGLAGITVETGPGMSISLDRGPGGLAARRRTPDGRESRWTVLGASRGEGGILGEGIRQALLRDPAYAPALAAARRMVAA